MNANLRCGLGLLLALPVAGMSVARPALAARPKLVSDITSGFVKLSDLFSGLEPGQDCEIGSGPAPGGQIVINQPQLAAIAEEFGVDWQPGYATSRVIIERKGRLLDHDELLAILRKALVQSGSAQDVDITLASAADPVVSGEFDKPPEVDSMNYDHTSGRFSADLLFQARGVDPLRLSISGLAREMVSIPVASHTVRAGTVLVAADLQLQRVRKSIVGERTLIAVEDGVGLAVKRTVLAGALVPLDDLEQPKLVFRGMPILLKLQTSGLTLTTKGEAIDPGALGERVHVLNPTSRIIVVARVTGPGAAQVDAGSAPVAVASRQSGLPTASSLSSYPAPTTLVGLTR